GSQDGELRMTCRQRGYIAPVRFADCQRRPWNSEKIEDFRQVAIVGRWSVAADQERDRRARVHGVGVPSWVVASSFGKATGILRIVRDLEIVLLFAESYTKD